MNFKGWINDLITKHSCGFSIKAFETNEFVNKIEPYINDRSQILKQQKNARELAELYFSKKKQCDLLNQMIDKEKSIPSPEASVYTLTA